MVKKVAKHCAYCNKEFNVKGSEHRIVLEFRNKKRELRREYFCSKECFKDYLRKQSL